MAFFALWSLLTLAMVTSVNTIAIRGAVGGVNFSTGERPARLDFSDFKDSGPAFDLFIQSFRLFQQQNQSSVISYYRICGIHGHPYTAWDGVNGPGFNRGYCPHGSILFPPWHRPYLALFEELIWTNAQRIVERYPYSERPRYREAARTLRLPYWDWTSNPEMPALVSEPSIEINGPGGRYNVSNPLYEYAFHPQPPAAEFPPGDYLARFPRTVRYPGRDGNSQPTLVNRQLVANGPSLRILTYQLIAEQSNYAPFSNTGYTDGRGGRYNSIENMHNVVHSLVGNGGHMSIIPYSAFDPIFWLHHANMDRLLAIWQAIYPDSWVNTSQINQIGTFTGAPGSIENINTPLTPFHSDRTGTLYNSQTARYTSTFGYTYPEIIDWNVTAAQLSSNVRRNLNALLNPSGTTTTNTANQGSQPPQKREKHTKKTIAEYPNAADHQYFVNIRVETSSIRSSFFIHFFLGPVPINPSTWSFASNLIASHPVLAPATTSSLPPHHQVYGQIPLTYALLTSPSLRPTYNSSSSSSSSPSSSNEKLRAENVIPLLTEQLNWRIQTFDDDVLDNEEFEGKVRLYVVGQEVWHPESAGGLDGDGRRDEFPSYGPLVAYRNVTKGKSGGLRAEDSL